MPKPRTHKHIDEHNPNDPQTTQNTPTNPTHHNTPNNTTSSPTYTYPVEIDGLGRLTPKPHADPTPHDTPSNTPTTINEP
jgi:hypothetical protein